jgi:amino acid transporter
LVLTVYAGILWMTAAGNESKTDSAKNILIAAVIGLAIVMTAYTITMFVTGQMGGSTGPANTSSNTSAPAASGSCFDPGNGGRPVSGFSTEEACHNGGYDWVVPN